MIEGKWFAPGEKSEEVLSLRQEVFGRGADILDGLSWNALIYQDGKPAATGRIWWENGAYRVGDICTAASMRSQKLGDLTLRLLLYKAQSHAAREVRLRCPVSFAGFFTRLGFREESRENETMEMLLPGNEINLDSCQNCRKANCPNRKD